MKMHKCLTEILTRSKLENASARHAYPHARKDRQAENTIHSMDDKGITNEKRKTVKKLVDTDTGKRLLIINSNIIISYCDTKKRPNNDDCEMLDHHCNQHHKPRDSYLDKTAGSNYHSLVNHWSTLRTLEL